MSKTDAINGYIPLVEFLGKSLGPSYEVLLYDLRREEHPIVAIANGNLTGRKVGSLMKTVIVKMLHSETEYAEDILIRHDAVSRDGKQFKSSAMILRDEKGHAIGALCINFHIDGFLQCKEFLQGLVGENISDVQKIDVKDVIFAGEVFSDPKALSLESLYSRAMEVCEPLDLDLPRDRQRLVEEFWREGGDTQKGAVSFLAEKLGISEPTVYRYFSKVREDSEEK